MKWWCQFIGVTNHCENDENCFVQRLKLIKAIFFISKYEIFVFLILGDFGENIQQAFLIMSDNHDFHTVDRPLTTKLAGLSTERFRMEKKSRYLISYGKERFLPWITFPTLLVNKVREHTEDDIVSAAAVAYTLMAATGVTLSEICESVGDDVTSLVEEVQFMEDYDLRLSDLVPKIDVLSEKALLLTLLIISHNMRNIVNHPSIRPIINTCEHFVQRSVKIYSHVNQRRKYMGTTMAKIVTDIGEMAVPMLARMRNIREDEADEDMCAELDGYAISC